MSFQAEPGTVRWRLHLGSAPSKVYAFLATDSGRARFWAESSKEEAGTIEFRFPSGMGLRSKILEDRPPSRFALTYFGDSVVTFDLEPDGHGGADLTLTERGAPSGAWEENHAGWVSVLLALKAAEDFSVDLRSHDGSRNWDQGYVRQLGEGKRIPASHARFEIASTPSPRSKRWPSTWRAASTPVKQATRSPNEQMPM